MSDLRVLEMKIGLDKNRNQQLVVADLELSKTLSQMHAEHVGFPKLGFGSSLISTIYTARVHIG